MLQYFCFQSFIIFGKFFSKMFDLIYFSIKMHLIQSWLKNLPFPCNPLFLQDWGLKSFEIYWLIIGCITIKFKLVENCPSLRFLNRFIPKIDAVCFLSKHQVTWNLDFLKQNLYRVSQKKCSIANWDIGLLWVFLGLSMLFCTFV